MNYNDASLVITPNGFKASKLYAIKPTSGAGDLTVTRATTATRVNSAGLIESVAANVPRLDYTNSTCPSILVEPQRTNLLSYSEQFENAAWGAPANVIANTVVSPDGTITADTLTGGLYRIQVFSATTYVFSFYAKKNAQSTFSMRVDAPTNQTFNFNLDTGTADGGCSMINVGNGWYRCFMPFTSSLAGTGVFYPNVGGNNFYIWGAQLEAGSYATSYIPTVAATVTRNADVISKTGISSLIGQTEGTVLWDIYIETPTAADNENILNMDNGSFGNTIYIQKTASASISAEMYYGGSVQASFSKSSIVKGRYKCAFAYSNNNTVFFVNGVQVGSTDTSCSVPATSRLQLGQGALGFSNGNINLTTLWKTRLTNAELSAITTL